MVRVPSIQDEADVKCSTLKDKGSNHVKKCLVDGLQGLCLEALLAQQAVIFTLAFQGIDAVLM